MVNKVYYLNADKFPAIVSDYQQIRERVENFENQTYHKSEKKRGLVYALEALPPVRRVASLPDKMEKGDVVPALGLASLALINLPEDCRDIKAAVKQFQGIAPKYDYKNYQHDFSFFRGTAIEKWLYKHVDADKKWAKWLKNNDTTLANTTLGKKVTSSLKAEVSDVIETSITNFAKEQAFATKYNGSVFAQLTGRALRRTTLLGVGALALIELPKILRELVKADNIFEQGGNAITQTAKSTINVASTAAGIGYGGAIGAKYFGATGSLIGMGLGAIMGTKISTKVQNTID